MRRPGGYGHWFNGQGRDLERDTFTCKHCNSVVFVEPFQDPAAAGGWCMNCAALICRECAGRECRPFERQLEREERMGR